MTYQHFMESEKTKPIRDLITVLGDLCVMTDTMTPEEMYPVIESMHQDMLNIMSLTGTNNTADAVLAVRALVGRHEGQN